MRVVGMAAVAILATGSPARADGGDRWDGGTVALQAGCGLIGGAVGGTALGLAGFGVGSVVDGRSYAPLVLGAVGGTLGAFAGIVVGAKFAGDARGGDSGWGATTLGLVGGLVVTTATVKLVGPTRMPPVLLLGTAVAATVSGTVIGYQLGNGPRATEPRVMLSTPALRF